MQCLYWLLIFSRLSFYWKSKERNGNEHIPLSIVICAQNEEENLKQNLEKILHQEHDHFETIVVDDGSEDQSKVVLTTLQKKHRHLELVDFPSQEKKYTGKKEALSKGIHHAKHEWLLLTDADCFPNSKHWANKMLSVIDEDKEIVIGYAPLQNTGGFWNAFFRFETLMVAIQYLSYALCRLPYMGVGRNLLYKKQLFNSVAGFDSHKEITSGDDDLFISQVATNSNVAICIDPDSFMYSKAPDSLRQFLNQKTRQLHTSKYYKKITQAYLVVWSLSLILFYFCMVFFLFSELKAALLMYLFRYIYVSFFIYRIMKKLRELPLFFLWPIYEFLLVIYFIIITPLSFFKKEQKWK